MSASKPEWAQSEIVTFEYAAMPYAPETMTVFGMHDYGETEKAPPCATPVECSKDAISPEEIAEEKRRAFAAGREQGLLEGRKIERETQAAAVKTAEEQRMRQAADLINQFVKERDSYLHNIEQEVVKLALAVAARILRREAQMDSLLLTGAVRVALGQLSGTTEVKLRVPADQLELWRDAIALLPNLQIKPEVLAGEGMRIGDCVIETALGSVDLGVRSQLREIERGFFDSANAATVSRQGSAANERGTA